MVSCGVVTIYKSAMPPAPDHRLEALKARLAAALLEIEQLERALLTRHGIGVAQGMLMIRYGIGPEEAFRYLSRRSQDENTKLRDLALSVVNELRQVPWPGSDGERPPRTLLDEED